MGRSFLFFGGAREDAGTLKTEDHRQSGTLCELSVFSRPPVRLPSDAWATKKVASMNTLKALRSLSAALGASLVLVSGAGAADSRMTWQYSEFNDPENKGRLTSRLVFGVPETDNVQIQGVCDGTAGTGTKYSYITFGADTGRIKEGELVEIQFSGGGFEHSLIGEVSGKESEEGVSGVLVTLEHTDKLWQGLEEKRSLNYSITGQKASSVALSRGHDKIKAFHKACAAYAAASRGGSGAADTSGKSGAAAPSKRTAKASTEASKNEAFEAAKELGTIEAFEAFLANYASGFHADLARAYIKKLGGAAPAQKPAVAASLPSSALDPERLGPMASPISKSPNPKTRARKPYPAKLPCSDRSNMRSAKYQIPSKITFVHYSGARRDIYWIDYAGRHHNFITLKAGQQATVDTFLTHPWMVTDASGNCIEILLPRPIPASVSFGTDSGGSSKAKAKTSE
jgi:VHL beta domain